MKLQTLLMATLGFMSAEAYGQTIELTDAQINSAGPSKLILAASSSGRCEAAEQLAEKDIANKLPFLCLFGSIATNGYGTSRFSI